MLTSLQLLPIGFYFFILLLLIKPMGCYMVWVYEGKGCRFDAKLSWWCPSQMHDPMDWKQYLSAMLIFNALGVLMVYALLRLQGVLPFNPQHFSAVSPDLAFNIAASFVTNTNWQSYAGESTLSYFSQMSALTSQNFLSASSGMCLLVALIRGIASNEGQALGNFWVDMMRGVLYLFLPLSIILSLGLVSQGVIQNLKPNQKATLLHPIQATADHPEVNTQVIPMGPVASQVAIKQLGSNGGGFFNVNSAHPFENPTPITNFLEMLAILLLPASCCYAYGVMVKDKRQGFSLLAAMGLMVLPFLALCLVSEQAGHPALDQMGVDLLPNWDLYPAGNMEGKESRFGILSSVLWTTLTTASSNGSVNSMLDSYLPLGGLVPLWLMHLGEVIFGGVGCGLYGMLMLVLITVFVAGLMVGRTPEYLGKKIEPFEMKMACFSVLVMPLVVLVATALGSVTVIGTSAITNSGPHGFTEILYAFTSMVNNNGSSFAGLQSNTVFYNVLGGVVMLVGRYWIAIPVLAIAGSLARKKIIPKSSGTLATHTPLFIVLLLGVIIVLGALSFLPTLALGPIVEQLKLWELYGS
ncbi:MAG: potassium-transporting ATPase subunit KdpA [Legionellales bacterium]|nr:potassium-transporting ATPase subunit KdpA [Legionellales bacterium]